MAGVGAALVVGAPTAVASPSDSESSRSSSESADGSANATDSQSRRTRSEQSDTGDTTRSIDRRRSARAAERDGTAERSLERATARTSKADVDEVRDLLDTDTDTDAAASTPAPTVEDAPTAAQLPAEPDTTDSAAPPATRAVTSLRSVVTQRPVTVSDMVADTLTWVGLRGLADNLPLPAAPVSGLLESLWLAVRQTQYTWNNQRPRADVTTSGPGPDGEVSGNLNAVDHDDAALTYAVRTGPAHGTVVVDDSGGFVYTPDGSGRADSFTVSIDDTVGNPFHVHGLLGLLGLSGPTRVVVSIAGTTVPSAADVPSSLSDVAVVTDGRGRVRAVDGRFTDRTVTTAADAADVLNEVAAVLGLAPNFADPSGITVDTIGVGSAAETSYRFTESVEGVEVVGSHVILVTDAHGRVNGVFNNYRGVGQNFDVTPDPTLDDLDEVRRFTRDLFPESSLHTADLIVYALDDADPRLAWRVVVEQPDRGELKPVGTMLVFHADGPFVGEVIVTNANASAYSVTGYARDWLGNTRTITTETRQVSWLRVNELIDTTRNITTYRTSYPLWGLLGPRLPGAVVKRGWLGWDRAAVSAHANTAVVYDYFSTVLGRTSFDNAGALIEVSIRYAPSLSRAYNNAYWDPTAAQFVFGNRGNLQAALDVVGHEFTHAVVTSVVGRGDAVLDSGESGALNEAYADIFGMLVEGKQGRDRWLIGEDSDDGALRDLSDPGSITTWLGPYRARYEDKYTGSQDDWGEHINSTIFSHAVYRMMTDPATARVTDDMWATVFYQSLGKLGTSATFVDGRAALVNTARSLKWTDAQVTAIQTAFDDVGILAGSTSLAIAV